MVVVTAAACSLFWVDFSETFLAKTDGGIASIGTSCSKRSTLYILFFPRLGPHPYVKERTTKELKRRKKAIQCEEGKKAYTYFIYAYGYNEKIGMCGRSKNEASVLF